MTTTDRLQVARDYYQAYVDRDRAALERLTHGDFRFSSPVDDRLDRDAFFARCFPNPTLASLDFTRLEAIGEHEVVVTYELLRTDGTRGRNTEVLTVRDGRLTAAEVYFGWEVA